MKVLVVEDSTSQRRAIAAIIQDLGHEAVQCMDGEHAVEIFTSQESAEESGIDLVLMDVEMPGVDGFETTRQIRRSLGLHWIPIIFLSSHSADEKLVEGIHAGGDDYLYKPVNEVVLGAKLSAMSRIATMRDQLRKMNASLARMAETDALTRLYNRGAFDRLATKVWAEARRNHTAIALVLLDIDHFKNYNDHYGHQAGDNCIRQVARTLRRSLHRDADTAARYGGEEFVLLLPSTDEAGALRLADQVRTAVESLQIAHSESTTGPFVTISLGVASIVPSQECALETLLGKADRALYRSKELGRNRCTAASTLEKY